MQASSSSSSDEDGSSGSDRSSSSSFGSSAAVAAGPAALSAAAGGRSYRLPPGLPAAVAATQEAAAAEGRVELGPLVDWFVNLFWPKYMCVNYASSYAGGGLLGAVVIDTMGEFVPPRRKEMPNGTVR